VAVASLWWAAPWLFGVVGHEAGVQEAEVAYFRVLCLGASPALVSSALAGFYSGRGRTWTIMWVNAGATGVNLLLDWGLIFGRWGLPELGIRGAALATVLSQCFCVGVYAVLMSRAGVDAAYGTLRGWRPDGELLRRLVRFGLPSGVHFCLDIAGFTLFILLVGGLGTEALAATSITFNINSLAFLPMIGFGIAISVLVGQALGRERPALAARSVWSGAHLMLAYTGVFVVLYLGWPRLFVKPFGAAADPARFPAIAALSRDLLRFVAVYATFDAMAICFSAALKGAGDTRFVMGAILASSVGVLVVPTYIAVERLGVGIRGAWLCAAGYIMCMSVLFFVRFRSGRWKGMRVIEEGPVVPTVYPERAASDADV
jgi:MATE family multidrug resistance protein